MGGAIIAQAPFWMYISHQIQILTQNNVYTVQHWSPEDNERTKISLDYFISIIWHDTGMLFYVTQYLRAKNKKKNFNLNISAI